jgi:hypothetical protein
MVGLIAKLVWAVIKRLLAGVSEREPSVPQCRTVSTESNALLQLPIRIVGRVAVRLLLYNSDCIAGLTRLVEANATG